jgi:multicomponent K+:H+ antiporter subunit G
MMENRPEVPNHGEMKKEGLPTPQTQGDVGENAETAKQHAEPDKDPR